MHCHGTVLFSHSRPVPTQYKYGHQLQELRKVFVSDLLLPCCLSQCFWIKIAMLPCTRVLFCSIQCFLANMIFQLPPGLLFNASLQTFHCKLANIIAKLRARQRFGPDTAGLAPLRGFQMVSWQLLRLLGVLQKCSSLMLHQIIMLGKSSEPKM